MQVSLLAALEIVKVITSSAANDENFIKMTFHFREVFSHTVRQDPIYNVFLLLSVWDQGTPGMPGIKAQINM